MASVLQRRDQDDAQLARRVGAGDGGAFAVLDKRHRGALTRYAGSLLRRSEHDAQDIVQDVLIRAHHALRAGELPDELRPWLYRLTRNRAIDEVRRKRWGEESLDSDHAFAGDAREDPDSVLRRKESLRHLVDDLADLPVRQREALLARELDGLSPAQVAAQMGVSVMAAHKLAIRARENLIKTRDARDADCDVVRAALLDAHERGVRPTEHGLRHVKGCDPCRAYQRDIRRLTKQLHALSPAFGLPVIAGVVQLVAGGGAKTAVAVGAAVAVVATGGVVVLKTDVHREGEPSPFRLAGIRDQFGRPIRPGDPIPGRIAIVTAALDVPAGRPTSAAGHTATIDCPDGMRFAGWTEPLSGRRINWQPQRHGLIPGYSTTASIDIRQRDHAKPAKGTVGVICKRPYANGSIHMAPRKLRPGERRAHICTDDEQVSVYRAPGRDRFLGLYRGEPVTIQGRTASGRWTLVAHDFDPRWRFGKSPGWVRTNQICP